MADIQAKIAELEAEMARTRKLFVESQPLSAQPRRNDLVIRSQGRNRSGAAVVKSMSCAKLIDAWNVGLKRLISSFFVENREKQGNQLSLGHTQS